MVTAGFQFSNKMYHLPCLIFITWNCDHDMFILSNGLALFEFSIVISQGVLYVYSLNGRALFDFDCNF